MRTFFIVYHFYFACYSLHKINKSLIVCLQSYKYMQLPILLLKVVWIIITHSQDLFVSNTIKQSPINQRININRRASVQKLYILWKM